MVGVQCVHYSVFFETLPIDSFHYAAIRIVICIYQVVVVKDLPRDTYEVLICTREKDFFEYQGFTWDDSLKSQRRLWDVLNEAASGGRGHAGGCGFCGKWWQDQIVPLPQISGTIYPQISVTLFEDFSIEIFSANLLCRLNGSWSRTTTMCLTCGLSCIIYPNWWKCCGLKSVYFSYEEILTIAFHVEMNNKVAVLVSVNGWDHSNWCYRMNNRTYLALSIISCAHSISPCLKTASTSCIAV